MSKKRATRLSVSVQPGASTEGVVGFDDGVLRVRVKAPPIEGRANAALLKLMAGILGVPPSNITIVRGARTRRKLLEVEGLSQSELNGRLVRDVPRPARVLGRERLASQSDLQNSLS